ncbi:MAG: hypothetical protein M0P71_07665 [Melioribacteraceae bacterium]|jgi:hypothetical protein|nr:hypothetical protein [Melioribacteraceae bacterium]MDD3982763.1 hypothetical protein [Candidatus Omnitrophota bacterium]
MRIFTIKKTETIRFPVGTTAWKNSKYKFLNKILQLIYVIKTNTKNRNEWLIEEYNLNDLKDVKECGCEEE